MTSSNFPKGGYKIHKICFLHNKTNYKPYNVCNFPKHEKYCFKSALGGCTFSNSPLTCVQNLNLMCDFLPFQFWGHLWPQKYQVKIYFLWHSYLQDIYIIIIDSFDKKFNMLSRKMQFNFEKCIKRYDFDKYQWRYFIEKVQNS